MYAVTVHTSRRERKDGLSIIFVCGEGRGGEVDFNATSLNIFFLLNVFSSIYHYLPFLHMIHNVACLLFTGDESILVLTHVKFTSVSQ